jgi:hypothetical protein
VVSKWSPISHLCSINYKSHNLITSVINKDLVQVSSWIYSELDLHLTMEVLASSQHSIG